MPSLRDLDFEDLYIRDTPDFPAICNPKLADPGDPPTVVVPEAFAASVEAIRRQLLSYDPGRRDFAVSAEGIRLRVCQTHTFQGERAFGMRRLPDTLPVREGITDDPGIQEEIRSWGLRRGLVLIIGPTGSGKTTSAMGVINSENVERGGVTVTAEDPVEFMLPAMGRSNNGGVFTNFQWEVTRAEEWAPRIADSMRYKPTRILVGEARTPEAVQQLLQVSISGHLVICTTHGDSIILGLQRLLDIGKSSALGDSVYSAMADALVAVMHQRRDRGKLDIELLTTIRAPGQVDPCKQLIRDNKLPMLANPIAQQSARRKQAFR